MAVVGLDIDGVLTNIGKFQLEEGKKYFRKEPVNKDGFTIQEMFGCSKEEEHNFWKKNLLKYVTTEKARDGASNFTKRVHNDGDTIKIITSRVYTTEDTKMGKLMRFIVEQWLKANKIEYDEIVYCDEDKKEAIKLNNVDVMLEDNVDNIRELSKLTNVVCVDNDYNRVIPDANYIRIKDMSETIDALHTIKARIENENIRNRSINEIKPISGKASIDRPWMKYYSYEERNYKLPEMKIYDYLYSNNTKNLNKIALNYFDHKITYREMFEKIDDYAKAFQANGVKEGSMVTLCLPNVPEVVYMFYALNKLGAVANMVHPLKSGNEIKDCINAVDSKLLVMVDNSYKEINKIINDTNVKKAVVVSAGDSMPLPMKLIYNATSKEKVDFKNKQYVTANDFLKDGKNVRELDEAKYRKNQTAVIMYTGGTSGFPKGVELTNDNYNCMVHQQKQTAKNFYPGDTMLTIMPPFHNFGLCSSIHMPLSYGITTILVPKYSSRDFHKLIEKYKPNHIFGIPKLWKALMNDENIQKMDLSFLRYVVSGGENMKDGLEEEMNQFLHDHNCSSKVKKGYGLTEGVAGLTLSDDYCNEIGSIGIPLICNKFKVVKPGTEEELDYNEEGEFCVSGPTVMKQYFDNIEETELVIRKHEDGKMWLHTGDMGYMTEDGMLYYTDRLTRMYVSAGFNIYPPKIEKIIETSNKVDQCAVVPIEHPYKDIKVPKAYVILKDGYQMNDEIRKEISDICKENLDLHHQPYKYEQVDEFPITSLGQELGKIDYKKLEKEANKSYSKKLK